MRSHGAQPSPRALLWTLLLSLGVHGLFIVVLHGYASLPDTGLSLSLPEEVELSLVDLPQDGASEVATGAAAPVISSRDKAPAEIAAVEPEPSSGAATDQPPPPVDAGVPETKEATRPKRKPRRKAIAAVQEQLLEDAGIADNPHPPATSPVPPQLAVGDGAMVSLRVDIAALRSSPYGAQLTRLLQGLGDVQALLAGSGVDPMADLGRLWLASPDLSRNRTVLAGTLRGGSERAISAANALAAARGLARPTVHAERGVRTVPWLSTDETERVLALLDDRTFAIARQEDLPRVLRLLTRGPESQAAREPTMLQLENEQLVQLDVVGAQHFLRGAPGLEAPRMLHAQLHAAPDNELDVNARALFATPAAAHTMAAHLKVLQQRYGGHPLVQLTGLGAAILHTRIGADGSELKLRSALKMDEAQSLLAALIDSLPPPPASPARRQD